MSVAHVSQLSTRESQQDQPAQQSTQPSNQSSNESSDEPAALVQEEVVYFGITSQLLARTTLSGRISTINLQLSSIWRKMYGLIQTLLPLRLAWAWTIWKAQGRHNRLDGWTSADFCYLKIEKAQKSCERR